MGCSILNEAGRLFLARDLMACVEAKTLAVSCCFCKGVSGPASPCAGCWVMSAHPVGSGAVVACCQGVPRHRAVLDGPTDVAARQASCQLKCRFGAGLGDLMAFPAGMRWDCCSRSL